jgi:hypothetical protein
MEKDGILERLTALERGLLAARAGCFLCAHALAVVASTASHLDSVDMWVGRRDGGR